MRGEVGVGTTDARGIGVHTPVHPIVPFQRGAVSLCDRSLAAEVYQAFPLLCVFLCFTAIPPGALIMDCSLEEFRGSAVGVKGNRPVQKQLDYRPYDPVRMRGAPRNINCLSSGKGAQALYPCLL